MELSWWQIALIILVTIICTVGLIIICIITFKNKIMSIFQEIAQKNLKKTLKSTDKKKLKEMLDKFNDGNFDLKEMMKTIESEVKETTKKDKKTTENKK